MRSIMSFSWKFVLAGTAIAVGATLAIAHAESAPDFSPPFMQHMGMGMGQGPSMMHMGGMGMAHDSTTMAQLGTIHELFVNHDKIKRTVANLPNGIRTTTESDDPKVAQLLKEHVASMRQRVEAGDDPGLPIESDALRSIFRNYDKIQTQVETTEKGVVVTQTSADKDTVAYLQQHASEVSDFVAQGMRAMRTAMMKQMDGMRMGPGNDFGIAGFGATEHPQGN